MGLYIFKPIGAPTGAVEDEELIREKPKRILESYPSRNKWMFGGRGLQGPSSGVFILSFSLTVVALVAFFVFEGPWMWSWFSPAIPVVMAWLFLTSLAMYLITSFSDPGIIPRKVKEGEDNPFNSPAMSKSASINGVAVSLKYCTTCAIYRPPRAVHCGVCDNCVDRFDHHCPWTGNCIGRRNYRNYLYMVTSYVLMDLLFCFSLVAKIAVLAGNSPNSGGVAFWEACTIDPAAPLLILFSLVFIAFQGQLLVYHVWLSWKAETTNESKKNVYRNKINPHRRSGWRNLFSRFFGYNMARYIKFHYVAMEKEHGEHKRVRDVEMEKVESV